MGNWSRKKKIVTSLVVILILIAIAGFWLKDTKKPDASFVVPEELILGDKIETDLPALNLPKDSGFVQYQSHKSYSELVSFFESYFHTNHWDIINNSTINDSKTHIIAAQNSKNEFMSVTLSSRIFGEILDEQSPVPILVAVTYRKQ